jgi:hypothetical protein
MARHHLGSEIGPFLTQHPTHSGGGDLVQQGGKFVVTRVQAFRFHGEGVRAVNVWFRSLEKLAELGKERKVRIAQPPDNGAGGTLQLTNEVITGLRLGMDADDGRAYDLKQRWLEVTIHGLQKARLGKQEGPFRTKEPEDNGGGDQPLLGRDNVLITAIRMGKDDTGANARQHWLDIWCSPIL